MSTRQLELVALAGFVAAAAFAVTRPNEKPTREEGEPTPITALDAIPSEAAFVATIDLPRVRESTIGGALTANGRELPGIGRIDELCGFDPTGRIERLALAFPSGGPNDEEFGVVAIGKFTAEEIVRCAIKTLETRGGRPVTTRIGSFQAVRDRGQSAGEIAVRDGGPVLLAGGGYLRDMIDAADGRTTSMKSNGAHRALRQMVEAGGAVTATWVAPKNWFEKLAGAEAARISPLAKVSSAAFRLDFAPKLEARAVIRCSDTGACQDVGDFIEGFREHELAPMARNELGIELGDDKLGVVTDDDRVLVALLLDPKEATAAFARAVTLALEPPPPPAPSGSAAVPKPDEIIEPKR